ncbi:MAG: PAS domain S-box protein [Syntrophorhabdales bacterium]
MTLKEILEAHRDEIIREWTHRLHGEVSPRYSDRPPEELIRTNSEAAEAYFAVLVHEDFAKIDAFIAKIGRMRLQGGFSLTEVQKAFELYRTILLPILAREMEGPLLLTALQKINSCLSYTILKFSDFFQSLHEKVIGRPYLDFVAPEFLAEVSKICDERATTGQAKEQYVYLRRCKDGTYRYTENKAQLITFEEEPAVAGICRDITERMEREKRRLRVAELENENKRVALETLHQLMVTLSHYLLNANMIAGGMVRRCLRVESKTEIVHSLRVIEEQVKRIETVITVLKKVTDVKTASYTSEGSTLMIDVAKEIDEALMKGREPEL